MSKFQLVLTGIVIILFLDRVQSWFVPDGVVLAQTSQPGLGGEDSLVLVGDKGKELTIRNVNQRIGWSDHPSHRCFSIGVINSGLILKDLMMRPEFVKELEPLKEEAAEKAKLTAKGIDLQKQMEGLDRMSPEYRQLYEEYDRLRKEFEQWRVEFMKRQDVLMRDQLRRAYEEMVKSVNGVADQLDIDIVLARPRPDTPQPLESYAQAGWDVALRMIVRSPESIDITDQVRDDLGLEQ